MTIKFEDNSKACKDAIRKALERGLAGSAKVINSKAKALAPVDTGRLRSSIKDVVNNKELEAIIGTNVEYSVFVEFGTINQMAQPYLRPAFRTTNKQCKDLVASELSKVGK